MKLHPIEVDDMVLNYLKKYAEPLVDTPNSVLHKLLFGTSNKCEEVLRMTYGTSVNTPKALSQILDVIEEMFKNGHSRPEATKIVAERNGTAPQTIIDKYCRQLGKKASEVDFLLSEPGLEGIQTTLKNKFPNYIDMITSFFRALIQGGGEMDQKLPQADYYAAHLFKTETKSGSMTERKKRDTMLETSLKNALGEHLKEIYGIFQMKGQSQLVFPTIRVLCKFSSFHADQSRWFWGVSPRYLEEWEPIDHLALIMEDENRKSYSFIMLDSNEAQHLFRLCSESNGEKKINMRIYAEDGVMRFQEWKDFDVKARKQELKPKTSNILQMDGTIEDFIKYFKSSDPEYQNEMRKKLQIIAANKH